MGQQQPDINSLNLSLRVPGTAVAHHHACAASLTPAHLTPPAAAHCFCCCVQVEACEAVLSDAISPEVIDGIRQLFHKEPIFDMVQLHCALAALRLEEARLQRDSTLFERAQEHVDSAKSIQSGEMLPFMMQGMLDLAKVSKRRQE